MQILKRNKDNFYYSDDWVWWQGEDPTSGFLTMYIKIKILVSLQHLKFNNSLIIQEVLKISPSLEEQNKLRIVKSYRYFICERYLVPER